MAPLDEKTMRSCTSTQRRHLFTVHPFAGGGLLRLFSTHPPIAERVRRLRQMQLRLVAA